jgi:REP element-mobilizing transposase RayT
MATTDVMHLPSEGRAQGGERFNYKGMHRYIITQPVHAAERLFSAPSPVFDVLNVLRECGTAHRFDIYAYCFMPDRLLLIVRGKDAESDMKAFLGAFRSGSGAALEPGLGHPLWARKYTERVLRKTEESRTVARALLMTPVKEGLAASAGEYPFLGSFTVKTAAILTIPGWERKGRTTGSGGSGSGGRGGKAGAFRGAGRGEGGRPGGGKPWPGRGSQGTNKKDGKAPRPGSKPVPRRSPPPDSAPG